VNYEYSNSGFLDNGIKCNKFFNERLTTQQLPNDSKTYFKYLIFEIVVNKNCFGNFSLELLHYFNYGDYVLTVKQTSLVYSSVSDIQPK
jgi:hypothetical protein